MCDAKCYRGAQADLNAHVIIGAQGAVSEHNEGELDQCVLAIGKLVKARVLPALEAVRGYWDIG